MRYLLAALMAGGCWFAYENLEPGFKEHQLSSCIRDTEQIVLLRQIAATQDVRKQFDFCNKNLSGTVNCLALYFDANGAVRSCMNGRWYSFKDADSGYGECHFEMYSKPNCYDLTAVLYLQKAWRAQ